MSSQAVRRLLRSSREPALGGMGQGPAPTQEPLAEEAPPVEMLWQRLQQSLDALEEALPEAAGKLAAIRQGLDAWFQEATGAEGGGEPEPAGAEALVPEPGAGEAM